MKQFYVGIKGVVRVGDACLVLKKLQGNDVYWDIPGGRMDADESIEETLARELAEEVGLTDYRVGQLVGAYRLPQALPDGQGLVLLFYTVLAQSFAIRLSEEHAGVLWVTKDTLPMLLSSGIRIEPGHYQALEAALG